MVLLSSASGFLWYCKAVVRFLARVGFSGPYYLLPSSHDFGRILVHWRLLGYLLMDIGRGLPQLLTTESCKHRCILHQKGWSSWTERRFQPVESHHRNAIFAVLSRSQSLGQPTFRGEHYIGARRSGGRDQCWDRKSNQFWVKGDCGWMVLIPRIWTAHSTGRITSWIHSGSLYLSQILWRAVSRWITENIDFSHFWYFQQWAAPGDQWFPKRNFLSKKMYFPFWPPGSASALTWLICLAEGWRMGD